MILNGIRLVKRSCPAFVILAFALGFDDSLGFVSERLTLGDSGLGGIEAVLKLCTPPGPHNLSRRTIKKPLNVT